MERPGLVPSIIAFILLLTLPQLVGYLGASLTFTSVQVWYVDLIKPPLNPPGWVFGVVWTALYFMMGFASWLVWRAAGGLLKAPLVFLAYFAQLGLNLAWSYFFFGRQDPAAALVDIALLLVVVIATLILFWQKSRAAGALMVPYILWALFATYLNAAILVLNG